MQPKGNEKKNDLSETEKILSPILVVNGSKLKPYIELFEVYPENVSLQPLGIMAGFFKINELSDDSAYIVNFLSSVVKKEYYANPKRSVSESFDAALHKLNLALAEIAKNGNVRWIGKLDTAICVLEKNILHFTTCGAGQVLLLRNQALSDIGRDLNPEELEPNPLKTFSNVSSGYLEKQDKLIITSPDLFNIFSLNELKKGSFRFDQEKFVQFLKTAMNNELDSGATIVIDINESVPVEEPKKKKAKPAEKTINPFSGKTFENPIIPPENLQPMSSPSDAEYVDERTGHIYVQGDSEKPRESGFGEILLETVQENASSLFRWSRRKTSRFFSDAGKASRWLGIKFLQLLGRTWKKLRESRKTGTRPADVATAAIRTGVSTPEAREKTAPEADPDPKTSPAKPSAASLPKPLAQVKIWINRAKSLSASIALPRIFPSLDRIGASFSNLSRKQKAYALLLLALIILLPLAASRFSGTAEPQVEAPQAETPAPHDPVLSDRNLREVPRLNSLADLPGLKKIILMNDKAFAVAQNRIVALENGQPGKEFPFPTGFDNPAFSLPMDDLNLIFLISEGGKVLSFSPVSEQFKENVIALPENSTLQGAGTYLTYLYLVDSRNNQIFRYPRAADGFGEKTAWLKDQVSLSGIRDMAIEENIFLAINDGVIKLFQGKQIEFRLESTSVPVSVTGIFTTRNLSNFYVLDVPNGRVLRYSKSGDFLNQYYSSEIKKATGFAVDEKGNRVYLLTAEGVSSFEM